MRHFMTWLGLLCTLGACSPAPTATTTTTSQAQAGPRTTLIPSDATHASVSAPLMGQHSKSPLIVTGIAPNDWFFEASFPATLVDENNETLAQAPAQAQTDWTVQGPVPFKAELNFLVLEETRATLVLKEDMPGENNPMPREVRIPVVLEPGR
jgi:hypothetical protein